VAVELARNVRGRLVVVHVLPAVVPLGFEGYVSARMYEEMEASVRRWAEKRLDALVAQARRSRVDARPILLSGPAAHEAITRAAAKERSGVIVIGTHDRTGSSASSSAASQLGLSAPLPVRSSRFDRGDHGRDECPGGLNRMHRFERTMRENANRATITLARSSGL
jgi:nucleotide-binding universal stress UspA family protein